MNDTELKISVIGSGNVASSLAPALDSAPGCRVTSVFSRNIAHAGLLASRLRHAVAVDCCESLPAGDDVYLIAVKDDAVRELSRCLAGKAPGALWAHTSGSVPAEALSGLSSRYGVLYPLQTFSRERPLDLRQVPFFIEGSDVETEAELKRLAMRLSDNVRVAGSDIRRLIHVAAVFACNFTNHLWAIADGILRRHDISLDVLEPLLEETLRKAMTMSPAEGQTGPARRNDTGVMAAHERMLDEGNAKLYRTLSESIIKMYGK